MNRILETTHYAVEHAEYVSIDRDRISSYVQRVALGDSRHWLHSSPIPLPLLRDHELLHFLLLLNALSFSYWGRPKWNIHYTDQELDGVWAMIGALVRAVNQDRRILDFAYLLNLTLNDLKYILRGNAEIPLLHERYSIITELSLQLVTRYNGLFANITAAAHDTTTLLEALTSIFPSFKDTSTYKGREIIFHKRAQLLLADISCLFPEQKTFSISGTEHLTACADYKLPAVLRHLEILRYNSQLSREVDAGLELDHGSEKEIEIRSATIWAVEFLRQELQSRYPQRTILAREVNDHLWLLGQSKENYQSPYHLTRTTCY